MMQRRGCRRRVVLLAVVMALFVTSLPAAASGPAPRGIDRVCPIPGVVDDPETVVFPDLGTTHADAITCAVAYGMVSGFEDGTYQPERAITRGQMASFVAFWLQAATGFVVTLPDEMPFTDVAGTSHEDAIARLSGAGLIGGRSDGTFAPNDPLTRGQFAQVMVRAISYADVFSIDGPLPPAGDATVFTDVVGSTFEVPIGALAGTGITGGLADGTFRPGATVTRGQLATFLLRGADYLDRHQRWEPTAQTVVYVADLRPTPAAIDAGVTGVRGTATLIVNAFDGTLFYAMELADVPGPFGRAEGASVGLVIDGDAGPAVIALADGVRLDAAVGDRGITGTVLEAGSRARFAELGQGAYVSIASEAFPDGLVRGQLTSVG